jgi:EAL domain-containing protein (putative c-di-GMP-specific phosphodiesterase class I)
MFVSASIGIALYPADSPNPDTLLKFADSAMYHAKNSGRNNFQFYVRELSVRSLERMEMELALRNARKYGELDVYYQPQVDLETGNVIGAEALLRWRRPGQGVVGPDRFVAIAEECGLIVDIGEWVLRTACSAVVRWNAGRATPLKVAVNLSPRQFVRNDLVGTILQILAATGCRPEWLELEITEGLLLDDGEETRTTLSALAAMNIAIVIDDFGTGYSALSYLHRFPVSDLKIDRSFITGIEDQFDQRELIRAMLLIASALNMGSVAEGVETFEQAGFLRTCGCRAAQGYLFGRPMPAAAFDAWLAQGGQVQCTVEEKNNK